jgi:peptide/nickel transport system substrate-binding protein
VRSGRCGRAGPAIAGIGLVLCACGSEPSPEVVERPLHVALHGEPSKLDPHLQDELHARSLLANIYEALVAFDAQLRLRPALATRWTNPDDLTWVFELREGARFHDGRPVEAADVVASLARAREHPSSRTSGYLVSVAQVRALDDRRVELRTARPYPILLNKLSFVAIVPRDAPELISRPIGSGPYRLVGLGAGGRYRLELAEPATAPGFPIAADVSVVLDENRRLSLVGEGDLDLARVPGSFATRHDPGIRVSTIASLSVTYLQLPLNRGPFADLRVRRAVDLAVDRARLVDELEGGAAEPAGQLVGPQVFGYVPEIEPRPRDVVEARRLLDEAGYPNGFDFVLEVREGREVGSLIEQLAEVGLRAELKVSRWPELYPRLARGEVEVYLGAWSCSSGDASDLFDHKLHTQDLERGYGSSNFNDYSNAVLDRLIETSSEVFAMTERRRILEQAMRLAIDDLPLVPLLIPYDSWAMRPEIQWRPRLGGVVLVSEIRRAEGRVQ